VCVSRVFACMRSVCVCVCVCMCACVCVCVCVCKRVSTRTVQVGHLLFVPFACVFSLCRESQERCTESGDCSRDTHTQNECGRGTHKVRVRLGERERVALCLMSAASLLLLHPLPRVWLLFSVPPSSVSKRESWIENGSPTAQFWFGYV
jgi:hypothetical protein